MKKNFLSLRVAIPIFFLLANGSASFGQTEECRKAIFVYLDVSGSMYLTSSPYGERNSTQYNGLQMRLIDAMVYMITDIFSDNNTTNPLLYEDDRFELVGFYDDTNYLIPPIRSFTPNDGRTLASLHKRLDKDKNGQLNQVDFASLFPGQSTTNFNPVVDDFNRKLLDVRISRIKYKSIIFLVFSDGDHERSLRDLSKLAEQVKRDHELLFRRDSNVRVKFIYFELSPTNVSELFRKQLDADVRRIADIKNISEELQEVKQRIEYAIGDFILFKSISPEEFFLNLQSKQKKLDLVVELLNQSCVEEKLSGIDLAIQKEDENHAVSKIVPLKAKSIPALTDSTLTISIPVDIKQPGVYELTFAPITENRNRIPESEVKMTVKAFNSSVNPATLLIGALLLLFVVIFFVFLRLKTRHN